MGLETKCEAKLGAKVVGIGRLHLDSSALTFGSKETKWQLSLSDVTKVSLEGGWLKVTSGRKHASFYLEDDCEKWAKKILNPPSRLQKLGLKPEQACLLQGSFESAFEEELTAKNIPRASKVSQAAVAICKCESIKELNQISRLVESSKPKTHFWIVWPKGDQAIPRNEVIQWAKHQGMGPGKSCAFDDVLSAMRFTTK